MLRFSTAGESHGRGVIALIESFPAGYEISPDTIDHHLARRQRGYGRGGRMKIEHDRVIVLSGLRHGKTIGSPIACLIENRDWSNWQDSMDPNPPSTRAAGVVEMKKVTAPRPGHADLPGGIKYHTHDLRDVLERASARETAARVVCGAIARQLLETYDIRIASHVLSIGSVRLKKRKFTFEDIERSDDSPVRCIDRETSRLMIAEIDRAKKDGDTLGGVFEMRATGVPVGLGSAVQWHMKLESMLGAAIMSIQSVKGMEVGDGFSAGRRRGSQVHDEIYYRSEEASLRHKGFYRRTNAAGGIEGGISNGAEIIIRAACKPISTLLHPLKTVDVVSKKTVRAQVERSDVCIVPAAGVVGEAMVAMVLASAFTDKFGHDSRADIDAAVSAYLKRDY